MFYLARRFMLAIGIVFLMYYPRVQMMGAISMSLLWLCYLIYVRPLTDWELMFCEVFNECCILCISVSVSMFSEYADTSDETQFKAGIFICVLIWLIIVLNIFAGIGRTCYNIMLRYKRRLVIKEYTSRKDEIIAYKKMQKDLLFKEYEVKHKDSSFVLDIDSVDDPKKAGKAILGLDNSFVEEEPQSICLTMKSQGVKKL